MDTEADEPSFKKRKIAAPTNQGVLPAPASLEEPPDTRSPRSADKQQPILGLRAAAGGADCISDLPDALLGEIISLLPIKDGARTQILASRWRHLWLSVPLNLDCRGLGRRGKELADLVSGILSSHQSHVRRFCVDAINLRDVINYRCDDLNTPVNAWLRSAALGKLEELDLWYTYEGPRLLLAQLPASTSHFWPNLISLTIGMCHIVDGITQSIRLPRLKELALEHVEITECSLYSLLARCPALECLLIRRNYDLGCVRISSPRLRSIGVYGLDLRLGEIVIEHAPCLERLLCYNMSTSPHVSLSVISAPKLETIGWISDCDRPSARLVFGSTIIQGLRVDSMETVVTTVTTLAIKVGALCLDTVIGLMRCFPRLERMYIKLDNQSDKNKNLWRRKHRNLVACLDIRLKTIVLEDYYKGTVSQVQFVTFFVINAKVLESMTLQVRDNNEKFIQEHRRKLQLENRASKHAQFHFTKDRCLCDILDIKRLRGQADPFIRRC